MSRPRGRGQTTRAIDSTATSGVEADRASIESEAGTVRITLVRSDGVLVGEKRLELKATCEEMAAAIAVIIAIWERPLRPGLVPPLDPALASIGLDQGSHGAAAPAAGPRRERLRRWASRR